MLKKSEITAGVKVEIIKHDSGIAYAFGGIRPTNGTVLPQGNRPTDGVLITKNAGGIFDGGDVAVIGTQLEIIHPPKRVDNINVAKVKNLTSGVEGYVYWCELRASCKKV